LGRFDAKVALITGGARGQGRSHALALAREGADIALLDIAKGRAGHHTYRTAELSDLERTTEEIRKLGRRALGIPCDVTHEDEVREAARQGGGELGGIDYVIANAAIYPCFASRGDLEEGTWDSNRQHRSHRVWLTCKYHDPARDRPRPRRRARAGPRRWRASSAALQLGLRRRQARRRGGSGSRSRSSSVPTGIRSNVFCRAAVRHAIGDASPRELA